jgi:hypothetical protein
VSGKIINKWRLQQVFAGFFICFCGDGKLQDLILGEKFLNLGSNRKFE